MADFAPELKDPPMEDYTRASRGWENDVASTAIKGASDLFKGIVTTVDQYNKRSIVEQARATVDEASDRSIAELHSISRTPLSYGGNIPAEIPKDMERLKAMKQAVDQGSFRESNYWGVLDATARKLRSKYPGYRDHIDDTFKQLTGSIPANALMRELRQDAERVLKGDGGEGDKFRMQLIKTITGEHYLPQGWETMPTEKLLAYRAAYQGPRNAVTARKSELELYGSQKKVDISEHRDIASNDWGTRLRQLQGGMGSPVLAASLRELDGLKTQFMGNDPSKPHDPKAIAQFVQLSDKIATQLEGEFEKFISAPRSHIPNNGSYASLLGADAIKELRENQLTHIVNMYRKAAVDKDFGILKHAAQLSEVYGDTTKAEMLGGPRGKFLTTVQTMQQVVGPQGMNIILSGEGGGQILKATQETLKQYVSVALSDPNGAPTSLKEKIDEVRTAGGKDGKAPQLVQEIVNTNARLVASPVYTGPAKAKLIDGMYGARNEVFLSAINTDPSTGGRGADPQRVFDTMANPAIAKEIHRFSKESGDMSHWEKYQSWVIKQTYALNVTDINTVSRAMTNQANLEIKFNPSTFQFDVKDKPLPPASRPGETTGMAILRAGANMIDAYGTQSIKDTITKVNQTLRPVRDIVDINGDKDRNGVALAIITQMHGLAESKYGPESVSQSIITKLGEAIYNRPWEPKKFIDPVYKRTTPEPTAPVEDSPSITDAIIPKLSDKDPMTLLKERAKGVSNWIGGLLPSREATDRQRNLDRMGGQVRPPVKE